MISFHRLCLRTARAVGGSKSHRAQFSVRIPAKQEERSGLERRADPINRPAMNKWVLKPLFARLDEFSFGPLSAGAAKKKPFGAVEDRRRASQVERSTIMVTGQAAPISTSITMLSVQAARSMQIA